MSVNFILDMDDDRDLLAWEELPMWGASDTILQPSPYRQPSTAELSQPPPVVSNMPRPSNDISHLWSELGRQQKVIEKQELTMNAILDEVRSLSLRMTSAPVAEVCRTPPKVLSASKKEKEKMGGRPGKKPGASSAYESDSDSDDVPDTSNRGRRGVVS